MHGSIFHGFKQFVVRRHGQDTWQALVTSTGLDAWYHATGTYPDPDLQALVDALAHLGGRPSAAIWEEFGKEVVASLVGLYGAYLDPSWGTLELLTNVERVVHRTIRMRDKAATPPHLRPKRISPDEVQIKYVSPRRLCTFAVGLCRGVAAHYREAVVVEHSVCMLAGAAECLITVRLVHEGAHSAQSPVKSK